MNTATTTPPRSNWPVNILAAMMFLIPAVGVPSELILQDSLKSSVLSIGTLLAALTLLWRGVNTNSRLHFHGVLLLPLVLALYGVCSVLWSHAYLGSGEAIRWFLVFTLAWLCLNMDPPTRLTRMLWGLHWGAVMASVWAVLQYWFALDWFPQAAFPASTFANRNFFAEYAVCALPYSIWLFLQATPKRWAAPMAMSLALCITGLIAAGTRSALIAFLVLAIVAVIAIIRLRHQPTNYAWPRQTRLAALLAFVATLAFFNTLPSVNRLAQDSDAGYTLAQRLSLRASSLSAMDEYTKGSFSERVVMWKATARMAMANPLTGVGAGAWEVYIPLYQEADTDKEFDYFAHNDVFQLLSEYGLIVGGGVLAFFVAFALKWGGAAWSGVSAGHPDAPLRTFALASMLMLLVVAGAGFPLHLAPCSAMLGLSIGILAATDQLAVEERRTYVKTMRWNQTVRVLAICAVSVSLLAALAISIQAFRAERKLLSALGLATEMVNAKSAQTPFEAAKKARLLEDLYTGVGINPHARKLTPIVADRLAAAGELRDAVSIWRATTESRPHIAVLWSNLALGYSNLGQHTEALAALEQFRRLRPSKPENISIEITLRRNAGDMAGALQMVRDHFRDETYDFGIVQAGFETAVLAKDWPLAIEALERRNQSWPELKADAWLQLGLIYRLPEVNQPEKAQAAFRAGLLATAEELKGTYRYRVPLPYRDLL